MYCVFFISIRMLKANNKYDDLDDSILTVCRKLITMDFTNADKLIKRNQAS